MELEDGESFDAFQNPSEDTTEFQRVQKGTSCKTFAGGINIWKINFIRLLRFINGWNTQGTNFNINETDYGSKFVTTLQAVLLHILWLAECIIIKFSQTCAM